MSLTGLKKHVRVLEDAELVTTEKVGRSRRCTLGPQRPRRRPGVDRLSHRRMLEARLDRLRASSSNDEGRTKGESAMTQTRRPAAASARSTTAPRRPRDPHRARCSTHRASACSRRSPTASSIARVVGPARDQDDRRQARRPHGRRLALPDGGLRRQRDRVPRDLPRGDAARAHRLDVRVERHARATCPSTRRSSRTSATAAPGSSRRPPSSSTEERDGMIEAGMEGGLQESYERLDELLAKD